MNFQEELIKKQQTATQIVLHYLPKEEGMQKTVFSAMNYSVDAPGKRLRPVLMMETYRMFGGKFPNSVLGHFMAAQEYIHTYSLVHDDLPAMDNDEYRRGRKTTHVVYGEAMAILAGDGLLHYAFETAANSFSIPGADAQCIGKALQILGSKSGVNGMLGGQVVDVEMEGKELDDSYLDFIYRLKTAALLESSMMIGAVLAGADSEQLQVVESVARKVGIAFQIQDDILDITSTTEKLGKPTGSDAKNHKMTYAVLHGIDESEKKVETLSCEAVEQLEQLGLKDSFVKEVLLSLIHRKK